MHAKQGQRYLKPQDVASRARQTASMGTLWAYLLELIERHLGVKHLESSLSP